MFYLLFVFLCAYRCPICLDYLSNMAGVLLEAMTAYPSRAPAFISNFWWVRVAHLYCLVLG